jgi:hypothetical protein
MKSLFRAFEKYNVRYLLISGQACVLYGASQFTEDIDFWIQPKQQNFRAFLRAMAQMKATVYKLTPPITQAYIRKGHGFHFKVDRDWYIDVMGKPPRVGDFQRAFRKARKISTEWGMLTVVAQEDLVLLKRTNRPGDYETISNLVRQRLSEEPTSRVLRWALSNTFDIADLVDFSLQAAEKIEKWPSRAAVQALLPLHKGKTHIPEKKIRRASDYLLKEMAELQEKGRRYWKPIIADLKNLQRSNRLVPEGTPVYSLL